MSNRTKKLIVKAVRQEAEKEIENLHEKSFNAFKFVKLIKKEGKDVEGGRCMRGRDGRLAFSDKNMSKKYGRITWSRS